MRNVLYFQWGMVDMPCWDLQRPIKPFFQAPYNGKCDKSNIKNSIICAIDSNHLFHVKVQLWESLVSLPFNGFSIMLVLFNVI
jgi:hypothetical protein